MGCANLSMGCANFNGFAERTPAFDGAARQQESFNRPITSQAAGFAGDGCGAGALAGGGAGVSAGGAALAGAAAAAA